MSVTAMAASAAADERIGAGTLATSLLLGLAGLAALLLLTAFRSASGSALASAGVELARARSAARRARRRGGTVPSGRLAEARRRWADALQDLDATIGSAPTSRALAEEDAWVEEIRRREDAAREAATRARVAARDKAVERHARLRRRAEEAAAAARVLREARALEGERRLAERGLLLGAMAAAQPSDRAVHAEADDGERLVAEQFAAVEVAVARGLLAERAAEEVTHRAMEQEAVVEPAEEDASRPPVAVALSVPRTRQVHAVAQEDGADATVPAKGSGDVPGTGGARTVPAGRPRRARHGRGRPELSGGEPTVPPVSPAAWSARVAVAAMLPVALLAKTAVEGSWWEGSGTRLLPAVALLVLLALMSTRWAWVATREPHALRQRDADRIRQAVQHERARSAAATDLLSALRATEDAESAWSDFEARTGLAVAAATRNVVDPDMDPGALVRYLAARQQAAAPRPQPLVLVTLVPSLVLLVPATLLLTLV